MSYLLHITTVYADEDGEPVAPADTQTELFDGEDQEEDMQAWAKRHGPWNPSHYPLRADMPAPVGLWFETSAQIGVDIIAPAWVPDTATERITTVRANAGDAGEWHRAFLA